MDALRHAGRGRARAPGEARGRGLAGAALPAAPVERTPRGDKPSRPKSSSSLRSTRPRCRCCCGTRRCARFARGRTRTAHVSSTYFDSPDFRLQRDGVALRVRRVGRRWIQTLKGPPQSRRRPPRARRVRMAVARPGRSIVSLLATTPWKKLVAKAIAGRRTRRLSAPPNSNGGPSISSFRMERVAQLCVDRGEIRASRGGRARARADRRGRDRARKRRRRESVPPRRGARRGFAARRDDRIAKPRAATRCDGDCRSRRRRRSARQTWRSPPTRRPTEALAGIARECLHQIAANAPGLVADDDPEWIHQMRVGTRRLRSCLSLMEPFGAERAARAGDRGSQMARGPPRQGPRLGRLRDARRLPPLAAWFARDASTAPGIKRASRARGAAPARRQERRARGGRVAPVPTPAAGRGTRLRDAAVRRRERCERDRCSDARRRRAVLPRSPRSSSRGAIASLPISPQRSRTRERRTARGADRGQAAALRRRVLLAALPGKRTRTYLETLAAAQDALGQFNDAVTAAALAGELSGLADAAAAGAVRGWVAAQAAAIEPRLAKAVRRFNAAKPFWPPK